MDMEQACKVQWFHNINPYSIALPPWLASIGPVVRMREIPGSKFGQVIIKFLSPSSFFIHYPLPSDKQRS